MNTLLTLDSTLVLFNSSIETKLTNKISVSTKNLLTKEMFQIQNNVSLLKNNIKEFIMKKTVLAIATTIILAPTFAMAGDPHNNSGNNKHESPIAYTGPIETVSVATLLADTSMFSEQDAIVDKIVRQLKNDTFIFSTADRAKFKLNWMTIST